MSERERIDELKRLKELIGQGLRTMPPSDTESPKQRLANYLLDNGVVVLPCDKVYYIVDRNSPNNAIVASKNIEELTIYEIKNLIHYGYYLNEWEAEEAMKQRK